MTTPAPISGFGTMLPAAGAFQPSDAGLLGAPFDPLFATSNNIQPASGFIYLSKIWVPTTITIANLLLYISVAGSGLTAAQNLAGIYDSNGNLVAQTADQATPWSTGGVGLKTMALTAQGAFNLTLTGGNGVFFWAAVLSVGTTRPKIAGVSSATYVQPGRGGPYVTTVPGAQHRTAFETVGGRTTLVSLNGLTLSDSSLTTMFWLGLT